MKKIISMLLSLAFTVGAFAVSVSAEGLTVNGITNSDSSSLVNSNESSYSSSGTALSENSSQSSNSADTYENSGSVSNAVNSDAISGNSSNETHSDESSYDNNTEDESDKETESTEDIFEQKKNEIQSSMQKTQKRVNLFFAIFPFIFVPILAFGIYNAITTLRFSNTSMKKKILPERHKTVNTITTPTTEKQTYIVPINGRMTAQKAETLINEWLAENPYIYNCKLKLETENSLISPFIKYKFFITEAVIEYSVADTPQPHQYGLAFIYRYRLFGPIGYNEKKHVAEWQANNTDCQIISSRGGHIQHLHNGGLAWAQYYNYIFFKK